MVVNLILQLNGSKYYFASGDRFTKKLTLNDYKITGDAIAKYTHSNNTYVLNPFFTDLNSSEIVRDTNDWGKQGWFEVKPVR